jgi:MYXO-CTERM domain-containing protein
MHRISFTATLFALFLVTSAAHALFPEGNDGAPCLAGVDCTSGHCVTGICCDSACDDAVCHACSRSTGATTDGTCQDISVLKCGDLACVPAADGCQPCVTKNDCAAGLVCDPSGRCVATPPPSCSATPSSSPVPGALLSILAVAAVALARRRQDGRRSAFRRVGRVF